MLPSICKLTYSCRDHFEELVLPYRIQLIHLLIPLHTVLREVINKVLWRLRILLRLHPCRLGSSMSILLGVLLSSTRLPLRLRLLRGGLRWEYVGSREYLIEMLKLLACFQSVLVGDKAAIDFSHVRETVDNEGADEHGTGHLVIFNSQAVEGGEHL